MQSKKPFKLIHQARYIVQNYFKKIFWETLGQWDTNMENLNGSYKQYKGHKTPTRNVWKHLNTWTMWKNSFEHCPNKLTINLNKREDKTS